MHAVLGQILRGRRVQTAGPEAQPYRPAIQTLGSAGLLSTFRRFHDPRSSPLRLTTALVILAGTGVGLLALHVIQVGIWAGTYVLLPDVPEINSFEQALYFSIVTFTTLGFGDITISGDWRLLSGIEAMNGILLFGWSTALLFAVVQRIVQHSTTHGQPGGSK